MSENLLGFPVSLVWGALAAYFYTPDKNGLILRSIFAAVAVASLVLPEPWRTSFWLPGGSAVVILTVIIALPSFYPGNLLQKMVSLELPSRYQIRDALLKTTDPDQKRTIYIKIVTDYARLWQHRDNLLTRSHTLQLLVVFASVHLLNYLYLFTDYIYRPVLAQQISDIIPKLNEMVPDAEKGGTDLGATFSAIIINFSAGYTFLQNSITILLNLFVMRLVIKKRTGSALPIGSLNLFRLPEVMIFIFIAACIWPLLSIYMNTPENLLFYISANLGILMAILYIFNGLGIFSVFLEIRLLPSNWIFMGIMLLSLFLPFVMFIFLGGMAGIGLADFFFNFRKRALHPVPPPV